MNGQCSFATFQGGKETKTQENEGNFPMTTKEWGFIESDLRTALTWTRGHLVEQPGSFPMLHNTAGFGTTRMGFESYCPLFPRLWHQGNRQSSYIRFCMCEWIQHEVKMNCSCSACQVLTSTTKKKTWLSLPGREKARERCAEASRSAIFPSAPRRNPQSP